MFPIQYADNESVLTPEVDDTQALKRQLAESVQRPPEVSKDGILNTFTLAGNRGSLLPAYGTRARLFALRDWYRTDEQAMIRGAFTGIAKGYASLPWEISGETDTSPALAQANEQQIDKRVTYFQGILRQANFGGGWTQLAQQIALDYFRYDTGAFVEVIAPGESWQPIDGAITGLAHLDPLRCLPTGDPLFPIIYYDRWGGLHVMHHMRVIQIIDSMDGDDLRPGYGDSSLSRAISIAARQMWESRYISAYLDDKPAPGLDLISGIMKLEFERAEEAFKRRQANDDGGSMWGHRMRYYSADASVKASIESHTFQDAPEKFDFRVYVDIDVDMLALAMGVDRQELMQLTGANIGSNGQSVILHQKSKGKTIGNLLSETERKLNDIFPEGITFAFRYRDEEEARAEADKAQVWVNVVTAAGTLLTDQQKQVLLASQSEAIHDAMSDAPRANDVDITPELPVIAGDDESGTEAVDTAQPDADVTAFPGKALNEKDYSGTLAGFTGAVKNLMTDAVSGTGYVGRYSFAIRMRELLRTYGLTAFKDGMRSGGVTADVLDSEDEADYMSVFIEQSGYVTGLTDDIYVKKSVAPAQVELRAQMWGKSLQAFLDRGTLVATKNGMFEWVFGDTDHCKDCLRLNGQVHRMRNWAKSGWLPRASKLKCKGFMCKCKLVKSNEKARGGF